ncbi:hypothetical protein RRG08_045193 [Elysia crispata]|uniref:Uncharacterized protein n=1 Tax=Elysia crispata TaxID=231223 RepID=A0AAE1A467_9GAST|nr:hypothetical protein RRG08_045193 [Elysia crispata]
MNCVPACPAGFDIILNRHPASSSYHQIYGRDCVWSSPSWGSLVNTAHTDLRLFPTATLRFMGREPVQADYRVQSGSGIRGQYTRRVGSSCPSDNSLVDTNKSRYQHTSFDVLVWPDSAQSGNKRLGLCCLLHAASQSQRSPITSDTYRIVGFVAVKS